MITLHRMGLCYSVTRTGGVGFKTFHVSFDACVMEDGGKPFLVCVSCTIEALLIRYGLVRCVCKQIDIEMMKWFTVSTLVYVQGGIQKNFILILKGEAKKKKSQCFARRRG